MEPTQPQGTIQYPKFDNPNQLPQGSQFYACPQGGQPYPGYMQPSMMYQQPMLNANLPGQPQSYAYPNQEIQMIGQPGMQQAGAPLVRKTGFQRLDEQTGVFIKQKYETLELVTGCETENKYLVYPLDKSGGDKKGRTMFKAKEKSGCCQRICLTGGCRAFHMDISTYIRGEEDDYEPFLKLERPFKCTCLCFQRPEVTVTLVEGGRSEFLGKIIDPWNWCDIEFKIYDSSNTLKYRIDGNCCQLGLCCACPCDPCQTVNFNVFNANNEVISTMQKRGAGCVKEMATDADNFALNFPANISVQDKALLMSAVLFLDYRHFEQNPRRDE